MFFELNLIIFEYSEIHFHYIGNGDDNMALLRWIGGVIVFFWLLGFVLRIGGGLIHILLVIAVIVFISDYIFGRGRR